MTLYFEDFLDDIGAVAKKHSVNLSTVDWCLGPMVKIEPGEGCVGGVYWCFDSELNVED